jgi:CheY-like chemotaxis protein
MLFPSALNFFGVMFRVAILDDRDDTRSLLRLWLEGKYDISDYSYPENLLADLPKKNFHLLLIAMKLRSADGTEVLNRMKTMPARPRPVLVALTGSAFSSDHKGSIKIVFDDFIVKPLDAEKLHATIHKYLR